MLLYAVASYFLIGAVSPTLELTDQQVTTMPGAFDVLRNAHPEDNVLRVAFSAKFSAKRTVNFVFVNTVTFGAMLLLLAVFGFAPYILLLVFWVVAGPVVTLTTGWALLSAFSSVIILGVYLVSHYWMTVADVAFDLYVDRFGDATGRAALVPLIAHVQLLHESGQSFSPVMHRGKRWAAASLDARTPGAFAVASYWLYCPSRYERGSTTIFAAAVMGLLVWRALYRHIRMTLKVTALTVKILLSMVLLTVVGSDRFLQSLSDMIAFALTTILWPALRMAFRLDFRQLYRFMRVLLLLLAVKCLAYGHRYAVFTSSARLSRASKAAGVRPRLSSFWNNAIMDFTRLIDTISIPNFIRSLPDRVDRDSINEGMAILEELGWPAAPKVTDEYDSTPTNISQYVDSIIGGTSIRQGIHHAELEVARELSNLAGLAPQYKRTEQYASFENELESLSRYFDNPDMTFPDLPIEDAWDMVGEIFQASKLTPFNYIIKKWEKKFGLGPMWGETNPKTGRWRKLSRKKFIKSIGGMANLVRLWAETFRVAHTIQSPAPVSIKSEALPPKKWMNNVVRTIVGAPITHYISSTIWNYWPNHNFKFWSTAIKIGMPLNGVNLSTLIRQHMAYAYHFAGDFSGFDATLQKAVLQMVAKIRKKGFEKHRDYAKICFLIDANYENLMRQPLMTTSTGNIYRKETGLSTGHSSTGMDNSIALVVLYLMAWRSITGLSAHEFRYYCKLSNYGDDHLLSWHGTAPASWVPSNIIKFMATCGCELRDEFPKKDRSGNVVMKEIRDYESIFGLEFLSKIWREPTTTDRAEMDAAGLNCPAVVIIHNPSKLVGKAYAPTRSKSADRNYRVKRLVSYMALTAHQQSLYNKLAADVDLLLTRRDGTKMRSPVPIPTYAEVLQAWYDDKMSFTEEDIDKPDNEVSPVLDYSLDGLADTVVNILSILPDVLNPAIFNMGYTNWLVSTFAEHLAWPVELLRRSNGVTSMGPLTTTGKRTFYDFLFENPAVLTMPCRARDQDLIFRHWLFCLLRGPDMTPNAFRLALWGDRKLAEANFILNGFVQPVVRRLDLPIYAIILVALLDYVPGPSLPRYITQVRVPSVSSLGEYAFAYLTNVMFSKIPANMKESHQFLDTMAPDQCCVLVEAPTGTGKSTTFVNYVWRYFGHRYTRVILVVPRNLLVLGLTPYLIAQFGLPAHMVTEGHPYDKSYRLIVTTPQEVLLHEAWFTDGSLILIDEAHVVEPSVLAVIEICGRLRVNHVMMTATPSEANRSAPYTRHVKLTIANTWQVVDDEVYGRVSSTRYDDAQVWWSAYRAELLSMIRARTLVRFLIFVPNRSHAYDLASRCGRNACVITATDKVISPKADLFIATAVADVGITIPDVDWVITSNITRQMDNTGENLLWTHVDKLLLKQRRGRTGRTNNGMFSFFEYANCGFVSRTPEPLTSEQVGMNVLKTTGDPNLAVRYWPSAFVKSLGFDSYERRADERLDQFSSAYAKLAEVMQAQNQNSYRVSLDGVTETQFWHIQGNTLATSMGPQPHENSVKHTLTMSEGLKFMYAAAAWMARTNTDLTKEAIHAYLRSREVGARTFKWWAGMVKLRKGDISKMAGYADGYIETNRFGTEGKNADEHDDPDEWLADFERAGGNVFIDPTTPSFYEYLEAKRAGKQPEQGQSSTVSSDAEVFVEEEGVIDESEPESSEEEAPVIVRKKPVRRVVVSSDEESD